MRPTIAVARVKPCRTVRAGSRYARQPYSSPNPKGKKRTVAAIEMKRIVLGSAAPSAPGFTAPNPETRQRAAIPKIRTRGNAIGKNDRLRGDMTGEGAKLHTSRLVLQCVEHNREDCRDEHRQIDKDDPVPRIVQSNACCKGEVQQTPT